MPSAFPFSFLVGSVDADDGILNCWDEQEEDQLDQSFGPETFGRVEWTVQA